MNKSQSTKTLKFKYVSGMTSTGKEKYSYNTISKVDEAVSDEIIFGMIELMSKVQDTPSNDVQVVQTVTLK